MRIVRRLYFHLSDFIFKYGVLKMFIDIFFQIWIHFITLVFFHPQNPLILVSRNVRREFAFQIDMF